MKSTSTRVENGDYLITHHFGDIRYTVRMRIQQEHYYFLSWGMGDQETAFASIPYDDIHFFAVAWSLFASYRPIQIYVLVGDTIEPVRQSDLNHQVTAQMLASHPIWCPVANMAQEHPFGPGGQEIKRGTGNIAPGAKVYGHPPKWGDGYERVQVTVHHRSSHRPITTITHAAWLEDWRVELVYEPRLIKRLIYDWDWTPESKALAEQVVEQGKFWAKKRASDEMR
ncbi:MAG TPA: hypothetical protein VKT82_07985 [Ktedonobacterales bacterium]|nr:hypothetical protein [Ktedonobacterales bacterium]